MSEQVYALPVRYPEWGIIPNPSGGKPSLLTIKISPWYKWYGFNTEQEFDTFWATYGNKIKLFWPEVSPSEFSSYEEYQQKAPLLSVKRALSASYSFRGTFINTPKMFGKVLRIKTSDGRTWEFDLNQSTYVNNAFTYNITNVWLYTHRALWDILRLATSPLVVSIEASSSASANALGPGSFNLFVLWIMQNRLPLTLTPIPNVPDDQQPPLMPPPYVVTLGGTTTGGTTGGATTGGTTTGGATTTGGTTTTAVVKSALPYLAIGAGVLLLLWAMKK
jgi:hypothetical protein